VPLAFKEATTRLKTSGLSHGILFIVEKQVKEFASDDTMTHRSQSTRISRIMRHRLQAQT